MRIIIHEKRCTAVGHACIKIEERDYIYSVPNIRGTYWTHPLKTQVPEPKAEAKVLAGCSKLSSPTAARHMKKKRKFQPTSRYENTSGCVIKISKSRFSISLENNAPWCSGDRYFSIRSAAIFFPADAPFSLNITKTFRTFAPLLFIKRFIKRAR